MRFMLPVAVCCGIVVGSGSPATAELAERTWTVNGVERKALVHVPQSGDDESRPVVFAFHGHGGTSARAARSFAYHTHWPQAIVVYMQGLNTPGRLTDPEGKQPGWQHRAGDHGDRDLHFFDAVLGTLRKEQRVDDAKIYATGHSNGGAFTYLLWAARGDRFAAVAPSACIATPYRHELQPKPALQVAGENDRVVSFERQQRGIEIIRRINRCSPTGTAWEKAEGYTTTLYASKSETPFVSVVHSGGHRFPQEAAVLITKFFRQHRKPAGGAP